MLAALSVFALTLSLVILKPKGLPVGVAALIGAVLALLLGIVDFADVRAVWSATWNATFTLIGLIALSLTLDRAGLFRFVALHLARLCGGRTVRLFSAMILFGAALSALFANDGAVLILTPIALEVCRSLRWPRRAALGLLFGVGFVVDAASLPLVTSNLTNIIAADRFEIGFGTFARVMLPVDLVAVLATLIALHALFGRTLPRRYDVSALPHPARDVSDAVVCVLGAVLLVGLLVGFALAPRFGVPESAVVGAAAALALIVAARRRRIAVGRVLKAAPWDVVLFSLGMYLVVYALRDVGLTDVVARWLEGWSASGPFVASLGTGGLVAVASSVSNNLPAVLIGVLAIEAARVEGAARDLLVYATIVGGNIGPKLTPIGSLATLLWLHLLHEKGYRVTWAEYLKVGLLLTPFVLLSALAALAFVKG